MLLFYMMSRAFYSPAFSFSAIKIEIGLLLSATAPGKESFSEKHKNAS